MQIATPCYPTSRPNALKRMYMNLNMPHNWNVVSQAFGSIKARFVKQGYVEEDVQKLRRHHEVSNTKPMSDRGTSVSILMLPHVTNNVSSVATY
jgi:hypothetical protein